MSDESRILFNELIKRNENYCECFKKSKIIQLLSSSEIQNQKVRENLLSAVQLFSDYFQKSLMMRHITTFNAPFSQITQKHLDEEFNHNVHLQADRKNQPAIWDPILESTAAWFTWKMIVSDNIEKTLLMHFVLESSANIFSKKAHETLSKYSETNFFAVHSDMDDEHEAMGMDVLKDLRPQEYQNLFKIQHKGWGVINAACDRMAELSLNVNNYALFIDD